MLTMSYQEVLEATGAQLVNPQGSEASCSLEACIGEKLEIDSRKLSRGDVFVAIAGERVDGNDFALKALDLGAQTIVLTKAASEELKQASVKAGAVLLRAAHDDAENFLLSLAALWRTKHPEWLVVGVTGSVGKTTTKDMLRCAFATQWRTHATSGNHNNLIGLPLTLLSAPEDTQVVICEMGMNHPYEIERLSKTARPCLATITNIGTSHIGNLGSQDNIARAKAEIISGLEMHDGIPATLVLEEGAKYSTWIREEIAEPAQVRVIGVNSAETLHVEELQLDEEGLPHFQLVLPQGDRIATQLRIPGQKVVLDYLEALQICLEARLDIKKVVQALEQMQGYKMRLDVKTCPSGARVIDDSYNANPASMAAALDVLGDMSCHGRRIVVLGEMGELGDYERELHALVGAYAAAKPVQILATIGGELAQHMLDAARMLGRSEDELHHFATIDAALEAFKGLLNRDDLVLVKASRSAELDLFVKGLVSSC